MEELCPPQACKPSVQTDVFIDSQYDRILFSEPVHKTLYIRVAVLSFWIGFPVSV